MVFDQIVLYSLTTTISFSTNTATLIDPITISRISSSFPAAKSPQILAVCTLEKSTRIASTPTISKKTHPKSNIKTSLIRGPKDLLESKKRKLKKNISGSSAESGSGSGLGGKGGKQVKVSKGS